MRTDIPIPARIARLPRDNRGYPVPFFTQWFVGDKPSKPGIGEPDARIARAEALNECRTKRVCWVCGEALTYWMAFVGGPLACGNRVFSDGPCHVECAEFSAQVCPHLANPVAKRRQEDDRARQTVAPTGAVMAKPEKIGVYICRDWSIIRYGKSLLWKPAAPKEVRWFSKGERIPAP